MVHVTFWLLLFLAISLLGQSNAVSDQCGELQKEIARIRELNRRSELLLGQCYVSGYYIVYVSLLRFSHM
jgi:hypothetical protein